MEYTPLDTPEQLAYVNALSAYAEAAKRFGHSDRMTKDAAKRCDDAKAACVAAGVPVPVSKFEPFR